MKAVAVTDVGRIEFVELPIPEYRDYECLVRTRACGLCNGTDLKQIDGTLAGITKKYPMILGHEAVGEVVEAGNRVRSFRVGDMITDPVPAVDDSRFFSGCAGFCEYGVVQDIAVMEEMDLPRECYRFLSRRAALVRPPLPPEDAAMLVTLKECLSAASNFGVAPGKDVLLYGDGPNGLALAACARLLGANWIGMVGHWDDRLERAKEVAGVDQTFNSHEVDLIEALEGRRVDLVIEAVGRTALVKEGFRALRPLGKVSVFGVIRTTEPDLSFREIPNGKCLQMLPWPIGAPDAHEDVLELVRSGRLPPSRFYTEVDSWENIEDAVARIRSREAFKIILTM